MSFANINGANLWYDIIGSGEPLLLHHGYTASRVNWQPIADRLCQHYQVIMMECRGTGDSEHTEDGYTIDQYAADVIGLLDHLDIPQVTYAGHSMGGGIGYTLAVNHADRLSKLILMAPIPSSGTANYPDEAQIQARLEARRTGDRDHFMKDLLVYKFRADVQTEAWFESRVDHLLGVSEGHLLGGLLTMHQLDLQNQLPNIETPTLMIAGGVDHLLDANLKDYALLPNASLHVLSRAGHEVAIHEPDGVADAMHQFLQHGPVTARHLLARAGKLSKV